MFTLHSRKLSDSFGSRAPDMCQKNARFFELTGLRNYNAFLVENVLEDFQNQNHGAWMAVVWTSV